MRKTIFSEPHGSSGRLGRTVLVRVWPNSACFEGETMAEFQNPSSCLNSNDMEIGL